MHVSKYKHLTDLCVEPNLISRSMRSITCPQLLDLWLVVLIRSQNAIMNGRAALVAVEQNANSATSGSHFKCLVNTH